MKVVYFQRRPERTYSIERVFDDVRAALPSTVQWQVAVSRYPSRGLWRRLYNLVEACFRQGEVNHVTGDVHFLTYLLQRRRTVLTVHDCGTLDHTSGLRKWCLWFLWYWIPARRAVMITAISEASKAQLTRYIGEADIRVVHNPIPPSFKPVARVFNTKMPVLLHVGTTSNKNLLRLAEALGGLQIRLRIIGALNRTQAEALARWQVNYTQTENLTPAQVVDEYALCDMVVFVSTYEGFGLPIVEAQATGRPVVTSNIAPMPEVGGTGACYVDPFDVQSIRAGVLRVMQDEKYRNHLIAEGLHNVERFRADKIARQYETIYREILKSARVSVAEVGCADRGVPPRDVPDEAEDIGHVRNKLPKR